MGRVSPPATGDPASRLLLRVLGAGFGVAAVAGVSAWSVNTVGLTLVAVALAEYAHALSPPTGGVGARAAAVVVALTVVQLLGVRTGGALQHSRPTRRSPWASR